jgi:hypothetical protein
MCVESKKVREEIRQEGFFTSSKIQQEKLYQGIPKGLHYEGQLCSLQEL